MSSAAGSVAERAGKATLSAASTAVSGLATATSSATTALENQMVKYETSTVLKIMRFINVVNGLGLMACGVVIMMAVPLCTQTKGCPGPATAVMSFYAFLFGLMLFLYEARMGVKYETFFRRYFGFMFGMWGRFFFILFNASMVFGLVNTSFALWYVPALVGAFTFFNALLNCIIIRKHPGFQSGEPQLAAGGGVHDAPLSTPGAGSSNNGGGMRSTAYDNNNRSAYSMQSNNAPATDNPFAVSHV